MLHLTEIDSPVGKLAIAANDGLVCLLHFGGDFVALAYLLGLARFFTMAAALDTGSAFEGMGAAREATFACLAEPALFLGFLALVKATGSTSLSGFLGPDLVDAWSATGASMVLVAAGLFIVMLLIFVAPGFMDFFLTPVTVLRGFADQFIRLWI